ncbi:MAG TPA: multiheme c-type cytochrome, partial [Planctomycetota bacterium]|nr:multiheme c-type cytochrome [Planctomycetota bacterium]
MRTPLSLLACFVAAAWLAAAFASSSPLANGQEPQTAPTDPHAEVIENWQSSPASADSTYPSARVCGSCHPAIYEEWSTSQHAYESISPMFHKFEQALNTLASGTVGAFCVRCHASVGTSMAEPRDIQIYDRPEVSREG